MTDDQIAAAKGGALFHIPTALGAIVLSYNIPEVKTKVKFSGANIVGIFLGDISRWNDPKLVADNPDLANMNQDTVTVHRSDGSGTTFEFTDYLSTVSPDWQLKVGKATSVNWPGGLGGSGNPGVAGEWIDPSLDSVTSQNGLDRRDTWTHQSESAQVVADFIASWRDSRTKSWYSAAWSRRRSPAPLMP